MRELVQTMLRIQELELILAEGKIISFGHTEQQEALARRIEELIEGLPPKYRSRYRQLRRTGLVVSRERGGVCTNCRMVIGLGVLNRMRSGKVEWVCPNCGRYLMLSAQNEVNSNKA